LTLRFRPRSSPRQELLPTTRASAAGSRRPSRCHGRRSRAGSLRPNRCRRCDSTTVSRRVVSKIVHLPDIALRLYVSCTELTRAWSCRETASRSGARNAANRRSNEFKAMANSGAALATAASQRPAPPSGTPAAFRPRECHVRVGPSTQERVLRYGALPPGCVRGRSYRRFCSRNCAPTR
jgi:hypothetical protein